MKKTIIKKSDGTEAVIITNDPTELLKRNYDAENDITKSHADIVEKIVDIDLGIQKVIDYIETASE